METFLLSTLCYSLPDSKPMDFTDILISLISTKFLGVSVSNPGPSALFKKNLNEKRQFQQLFVRQSRGVREGRGRQEGEDGVDG